MAIIKCPECGGIVSDKAPSCPHCGYVVRHKVEKYESSGNFSRDMDFAQQKLSCNSGEMPDIIHDITRNYYDEAMLGQCLERFTELDDGLENIISAHMAAKTSLENAIYSYALSMYIFANYRNWRTSVGSFRTLDIQNFCNAMDNHMGFSNGCDEKLQKLSAEAKRRGELYNQLANVYDEILLGCKRFM